MQTFKHPQYVCAMDFNLLGAVVREQDPVSHWFHGEDADGTRDSKHDP